MPGRARAQTLQRVSVIRSRDHRSFVAHCSSCPSLLSPDQRKKTTTECMIHFPGPPSQVWCGMGDGQAKIYLMPTLKFQHSLPVRTCDRPVHSPALSKICEGLEYHRSPSSHLLPCTSFIKSESLRCVLLTNTYGLQALATI